MPEVAVDRIEAGPLRALLLYAGVPVGLIAVCFLLGTYALLHLPLSAPLLLLAFCGTFLVYQFERALWPAPEDAVNHPDRLVWIARHRRYIRWSSAMAGVGALTTLPFLRPETLAAGGGLALLSLLYRVPVLPGRRRLKDLGRLKPVVIAVAWAAGGVLLPVLEAGASVGLAALAFTGYRLLFVLPNTLLADWPDRDGDARAGLITLATRCTAEQIRHLSEAALLVALAGAATALLAFDAPRLLCVDLAGLVVMLGVVMRPWPSSRWFYGFVIDGIVAWPLVTAVCAWLLGP